MIISLSGCSILSSEKNKNAVSSNYKYEFLVTGRWSLETLHDNESGQTIQVSEDDESNIIFNSDYTGMMYFINETIFFTWEYEAFEEDVAYYMLVDSTGQELLAYTTPNTKHFLHNTLYLMPIGTEYGYTYKR